MSLVVPHAEVSLGEKFFEPEGYQMSWTVVSVVVAMVFLRGLSGLCADVLKGVRHLFSKKYKDVEVQTIGDFKKLPDEIKFNVDSEVYHCGGCHHLGLRVVSKRACSVCRNSA